MSLIAISEDSEPETSIFKIHNFLDFRNLEKGIQDGDQQIKIFINLDAKDDKIVQTWYFQFMDSDKLS